MIISFNNTEFVGRIIANFAKYEFTRKGLVIFMILRLLFLPSTFIIALVKTPFFDSPAVIFINNILLGITNGLLAVFACTALPKRLDKHEKEFGGFLTAILINGGVALGSLISLIFFERLFDP